MPKDKNKKQAKQSKYLKSCFSKIEILSNTYKTAQPNKMKTIPKTIACCNLRVAFFGRISLFPGESLFYCVANIYMHLN